MDVTHIQTRKIGTLSLLLKTIKNKAFSNKTYTTIKRNLLKT